MQRKVFEIKIFTKAYQHGSRDHNKMTIKTWKNVPDS